MRKLFILSLLATMIAWGIGGCGGGSGGTSADPLGTDGMMFGHKNDAAGTDWSTAMAVTPRGTVILTAKVKNASGAAVVGREVSFGFVSNASGATLSSTKARTDSAGEAMTLFTAGLFSGLDVVRASLSNGATLDTNITVDGGGGVSTYAVSIVASTDTTPVTAGQVSIITATLTSISGSTSAPVGGVTVTFTLPVNGSGASFIDSSGASVSASSAITDGNGNAVVTYRAGSNNPTLTVDDVVQAAVGSITSAKVITRTAGAGGGGGIDYIDRLSASLSTVSGGQMSVITATVRSALASGEDSNQTITFTIPVNNSGASFINSSGASVSTITIQMQLGWNTFTDIPVTYKAGTNVSGTEVEDMVQAVLGNGSTRSILITRTASTAGTYAVSLDASTGATPVTAGQVSIITATVTSGSAPAGGVAVSFTLPINSSAATLSAATATTDGSGKAVVIYQPGDNNPTVSVQDTVQAAVGSASSALVITRAGPSPSAFSITVGPPVPTTVPITGGSSVITANVKNNAGTAVSGVTVTFVTIAGAVLPSSATTDGSGNAVAVFTGAGGGVAGATAGVVTASITIAGNTYTAAVVITYP